MFKDLAENTGEGDRSVICRFRGLQSKRPQVKTPPSQNVPELVKTSPKVGQNVPMVKIVGQNVPKMSFYTLFYYI